ncbi:ABC transporter permease [Tessaracoccus oleiagri]|uniref:Osmoprotectant transport system permease protein n=1 Tax=Tessaracoccus oleiagri TaxID=686624 RepID=A0A1G9L5Y8_9ACTN|nr:ABC transporter permease subunit [Tessaracoccus oleiagri]SDL57409.1 osmoprotectant transport system permease protein [Tessaracoccus oleiagri]
MNLVEAFRWIADPGNWGGTSGIAARIVEHLWVTFLSLLAAAAVALPVGVLIGHTGRGAGVIGAFTGAFRAIPTLGLLTLFGLLLGIGLAAPMLALVILAIPSLLAGAYSGIHSVDPTIAGAARAIGMSPAQVITRVELPLALPVLIGGIRAATLQIVATATLAAYTADYGLGRYLFAGLKTRDYPQMIGGAIIVIALALILELLLAAVQRTIDQRVTRPSTREKLGSRHG